MNRFVRIPITVVACVVWAGLALAQGAARDRFRLARLRERHKVQAGVALCPCRS